MKKEFDRTELFERASVPKALLTFAVPTVITQLISLLYNLADTFFVGKTDNPYMVAAVTLCFPVFTAVNAFGQLFGIGGGVLTSKLLGEYNEKDARKIGCFSFYASVAASAILSVLVLIFMEPILGFLGASEFTEDYTREYLTYVMVIGGIPSITSIAFAHLLRNEGLSKVSSFGLTMGGVLNIILDPLFMFVILDKGQEVKGAAFATMFSNYVVLIYFIAVYLVKKKKLILNLNIRNVFKGLPYFSKIMSVGFPAFIMPFATTIANAVLIRTAAIHGDIAVAALGISKKIDMLPMNTSLGLCQGMEALVSYNYANKNYKRMKKFINTTMYIAIGFAIFCIGLFELFTPQIVGLFITDPETLEMGVRALKIMVISVPFMISIFQLTYTYQSMSFGLKSLILSTCRQACFNIPMILVMNRFFGLTGVFWAQTVADCLLLIIAGIMYAKDMKKLEAKMNAED